MLQLHAIPAYDGEYDQNDTTATTRTTRTLLTIPTGSKLYIVTGMVLIRSGF